MTSGDHYITVSQREYAFMMTGKSESAIDEEDDDESGASGIGNGLAKSKAINSSCVNLKRYY